MNRIEAMFLAVAAAAVLGGCAIRNPMTPNEFRDYVRGGRAFSAAETFDVRRPIAQVADTFKKKAAECLNFSMASTTRPNIGFGSSTHVYAVSKSIVTSAAARTELHFQVKLQNVVGGQPADGVYYLIADASPIGKDRTRVDVYRMNMAELVSKAIRGWANGENVGCPDPTKIVPG